MNCLEEYRKIFEQYPLTDIRLKKARNAALQNWQIDKNDYQLLKSELCSFIKENHTIINTVFIKRVVCPLIDDCLGKNDGGFIEELIQTVGTGSFEKITIKDIADIYFQYSKWETSPVKFANELLQYSNSESLLEFKFNLMQEQICYSIHELPIGILETDVLSVKNYNTVFDEMEETARKLNRSTDTDRLRRVYAAYADYLSGGNCAGFEEYLNKNNIDYRGLFCK
ncbi:MAG: hypothetical protein PUC05_00855 [Firmicutes bacterium]|nr:hypothetical protein [Bacillota bacterium]